MKLQDVITYMQEHPEEVLFISLGGRLPPPWPWNEPRIENLKSMDLRFKGKLVKVWHHREV